MINAVLTSSVLLVLSPAAWSQNQPASDSGEPVTQAPAIITSDAVDFAASQIDSGEAAEALQSLTATVTRIELQKHRYHPDLLQPLTLMGDAHMALSAPDKALEHYRRAKHVARVNNGLFDPAQMPVVYREADALRKIGDIKTAAKREEYGFEIARRTYPEYDPQLLAPLNRLAEFYLDTDHPIPARTLLNQAYLVHQKNHTDDSPEAIEVLRGIARTHRLERFPPIYIAAAEDYPEEDRLTVGLRTRDLDNQYRSINSFPAGERALQRVVEIQRERFGEHSQAELDAILELADWHLLFDRTHHAFTLYRHVYEQMEKNAQQPADFFANPHLLYYPRPENPRQPSPRNRGELTKGNVSLAFDVSVSGRVRGLKTVANEGPKSMVFRVRRSMRASIFRPRLDNGTPVSAEGQTFGYEFPYFPRLSDANTDDSANES